MTSISHALIGAAIAARIPSPITVATLTFVTHFFCDSIPHWDLGTNWRGRPRHITGILAIIETLIALFGTFLLFRTVVNPTNLMIGITFSGVGHSAGTLAYVAAAHVVFLGLYHVLFEAG